MLDLQTVRKEVEEQRPPFPAGLLSRQEKDRLIERGLAGLYRWYLSRSQAKRNWNPDHSFNWRAFRTDHSPEVNQVLEGFFAIEQYVPDYTSKTIQMARRSYGRSHFQIRWGAEEEKHADLWLNTLLFSRYRSPKWIQDYKDALREQEYDLPWEDGYHVAFYTVIQERATQLNYLNMALLARGKSKEHKYHQEKDPVLEHVSRTIAIDEAAHYNFFLEVARLFIYYYPARAIDSLVDVITHFAMPAMEIIPNPESFYEGVYKTGIYGSARQYGKDVLQPALNNLGIKGRRALLNGVKRSRLVPDADGNLRGTAIFSALDYGAVQTAIERLFGRIRGYEEEMGLAEIDPTVYMPSGMAIG